MINIGLQPEYVANILGLRITNSFLTTVLVTLILAVFAVFFSLMKNRKNFITEAMRVLVYELLKLIDTVTRDRKISKKILPLVATFFIFIVTANLLALVPGFLGSFFVETKEGIIFPVLRSPNSDLTTTLALALFSVISIQFFSLRVLGLKGYLRRFFNFRGPLFFILGFFEMISEGVKVLSFSFRLFGNVFAGEILIFIIAFLVPYIIPLPFIVLEVFVGIIQAFIFAMLTLTFMKTSTMRHLGRDA